VEPGGSLASHLRRLLPNASAATRQRLETSARHRAFHRRESLHTGSVIPPFVLLDGHVIARRLAETGQVSAALIAGPGFLDGLRSISDPGREALFELVALTDGAWATWDPRSVRALALEDAGLAVGLLDHSSDLTLTLNMRLDERTLESACQRLAAILTEYGEAIFGTPHPVAMRADLAAMMGTSQVMMHRALRELEANGLVQRDRAGGIRILDKRRLTTLIAVAPPDGAPAL